MTGLVKEALVRRSGLISHEYHQAEEGFALSSVEMDLSAMWIAILSSLRIVEPICQRVGIGGGCTSRESYDKPCESRSLDDGVYVRIPCFSTERLRNVGQRRVGCELMSSDSGPELLGETQPLVR